MGVYVAFQISLPFSAFYCRLPGVCCAIYPIAQDAASFTVGSNSSKQGTKVSRALLSTTA